MVLGFCNTSDKTIALKGMKRRAADLDIEFQNEKDNKRVQNLLEPGEQELDGWKIIKILGTNYNCDEEDKKKDNVWFILTHKDGKKKIWYHDSEKDSKFCDTVGCYKESLKGQYATSTEDFITALTMDVSFMPEDRSEPDLQVDEHFKIINEAEEKGVQNFYRGGKQLNDLLRHDKDQILKVMKCQSKNDGKKFTVWVLLVNENGVLKLWEIQCGHPIEDKYELATEAVESWNNNLKRFRKHRVQEQFFEFLENHIPAEQRIANDSDRRRLIFSQGVCPTAPALECGSQALPAATLASGLLVIGYLLFRCLKRNRRNSEDHIPRYD